MIDNYDSFTYNLVQYFGELGVETKVFRNDEISLSELERIQPQRIVISPGPKTPTEAGISMQIIEHFYQRIPILGVCLGHQSMGQIFGGDVIRARELMHGKTSPIFHNDKGVFQGLDNPMTATRYHSLVVKKETLPECLEITAWTELSDESSEQVFDEIMGFQHRDFPHMQGVQFHPESIETPAGHALLQNFLNINTQ
jgi:anthranilate synthase component 2